MMNIRQLLDRRNFLGQTGAGLGGISLASLLAKDGLLAADKQPALRPEIDPQKPNAAREPHFPARAKNVLVIFCVGACSHIDTWDYKPELIRMHDKPMPSETKDRKSVV